jgi:hypothetical protein
MEHDFGFVSLVARPEVGGGVANDGRKREFRVYFC